MSQSKHDRKIIRILKKIGLTNATKISQTLQGSIWRATHSAENESMVIKVTDKAMHQQHFSVIDGTKFHVQEDILLEQSILKYITQFEDCPNSIVQFKRFFKSCTDYYLVMQDGGHSSLFDFVLQAHKFIQSGALEISEWQKVIKIIFNQMIECIEYLHSKNVCHFDISLENFLINDVEIEVEESNHSEKITFKTDTIQIRLCDFGLAQLFTSNECESIKYCGKQNYKSPEVSSNKNKFLAKKNDIWGLGVCLFMLAIGCAPFEEARESDERFDYVMNGKLITLLVSWDVLNYVDAPIIDLFESIFRYECDRMSLNKMKQHPWVRSQKKF